MCRKSPGFLDVVTTQPLPRHSGLTVAARFPKGVILELSGIEVAAHLAAANLPVLLSFLGLVGIVSYVGWLFLYGAARPADSIIPQFAPPSGFSPAMVGYLEDKSMSDRDFSAGIIGLAVARHLKLIHADGTYRLVRQQGGQSVTDLELQFERALFWSGDELSISATHRTRIVAARTALANFLRRAVMPTLLCKKPGNVRPPLLLAIGTIGLTFAALGIELGAFGGALVFVTGFAILGALLLVLAAAASGPGRWIPAAAGLVFLLGGLLFANATGFWLFLIALFLAATAGLAGASFFRLTVPTAEG